MLIIYWFKISLRLERSHAECFSRRANEILEGAVTFLVTNLWANVANEQGANFAVGLNFPPCYTPASKLIQNDFEIFIATLWSFSISENFFKFTWISPNISVKMSPNNKFAVFSRNFFEIGSHEIFSQFIQILIGYIIFVNIFTAIFFWISPKTSSFS